MLVNSKAYLLYFIGFISMLTASYLVINSFTLLAGENDKWIFIIVGIVIQVSEAIVFPIFSSLPNNHRISKSILLITGFLLVTVSITGMVFSQIHTFAAQDNAQSNLNEQISRLNSSVNEINRTKESYLDNSKKQSASVYRESRALGQDSINRAAELDEKKRVLEEELKPLIKLKNSATDNTFAKLEKTLNIPKEDIEFYFVILRAVVLEFCGIIWLSLAASLIAQGKPIVIKTKILNSDLPDNDPPKSNILTKKEPPIKTVVNQSAERKPQAKTIKVQGKNNPMQKNELNPRLKLLLEICEKTMVKPDSLSRKQVREMLRKEGIGISNKSLGELLNQLKSITHNEHNNILWISDRQNMEK